MAYSEPRKGEEAPVTTEESSFGGVSYTTTHPAFAQISASRVSGHANLYGSDFKHQHYMTVKIMKSQLHRDLNRDWYFGRNEYIEVALSESQWATFVSAPNVGSGVPCTLQHRDGKRIPGIPSVDKSADYKKDMDRDLSDAIADIDALLVEIDGLGLSAKKTASIKATAQRARKSLDDSVPFVAEQFAEYMEDTVEKGKQEIHGYMQNVIHRAGIAALSNEDMPLQLEEDKRDK